MIVFSYGSFTECSKTTYISLNNDTKTCSHVSVTMNDEYTLDANGFWGTSPYSDSTKVMVTVKFVNFQTTSVDWKNNVAPAIYKQLRDWNTEWQNNGKAFNSMSMVVSDKVIHGSDGNGFLLARVQVDPVKLMKSSFFSVATRLDYPKEPPPGYDINHAPSFNPSFSQSGNYISVSARQDVWNQTFAELNKKMSYAQAGGRGNVEKSLSFNQYSLWVAASVNAGIISIQDLVSLNAAYSASLESVFSVTNQKTCDVPIFQSDGKCDHVANNVGCKYDGDDCCPSTCGVGYDQSYPCGSLG